MATRTAKSTKLEKEESKLENQSFSEKRCHVNYAIYSLSQARFSHAVVFVFPTIWEPGTAVGESLRKSLHTCDLKNNLDKLESLLKMPKNAKLSKALEGLAYVLRQLLYWFSVF